MGAAGEQALFRKLKSMFPCRWLMLVQLKMSVNRLRLMQQKQTALAKQARRELAQLLDQGKEESARIRVENIIREDLFVEMLEILELYCELLLARFGLLEQMYSPDLTDSRKECDPGLEEAVKTIIYAAPRSESKELQEVHRRG
jgi:vacuolar protein sorting-associated protein IST1